MFGQTPRKGERGLEEERGGHRLCYVCVFKNRLTRKKLFRKVRSRWGLEKLTLCKPKRGAVPSSHSTLAVADWRRQWQGQ